MRTRRSPRNQEILWGGLAGETPKVELVKVPAFWPGGGPRFMARLADGTPVLGKLYKGGVTACTFANRSQAMTAACKYGGEVCQPRLGPVFYVRLPRVQVLEGERCRDT